jgi:hypothetical protein
MNCDWTVGGGYWHAGCIIDLMAQATTMTYS